VSISGINSHSRTRPGDRLVTLEEYRGFKVQGELRRTNPFHKDVFISSNLPEDIFYAYPALPTTTHSIEDSEFSENHDINWNAGGIAGHLRQCALIVNESTPLKPEKWVWGFNFGAVPGPPCNSLGIDIYRDQIQADMEGEDGVESKLVKYTIGHEVGHGVSFPDRVCMCGGLDISMMCTSTSLGPDGCLFTAPPDRYVGIDEAKLDLVGQ
jgi:hypothetical protein